MSQQKETTSLRSILRRYSAIVITSLVLLLSSTGVFVYLYLVYQYLYALIGMLSSIAMLVLIVIFIFYRYTKKVHQLLYKDVYEVTKKNLEHLQNREQHLELFTNDNISEINDLNEQVDLVNSRLEQSVFLAGDNDYKDVTLDFIDVGRKIVSNESFHKNLVDLIFDSQSYRNVLLQAYYPFDNMPSLSKDEMQYLIDRLRSTFASYSHILCAPTQKRDGCYLYIPEIDSISDIKEKIISLQSQTSIIRQIDNGSLSSLPIHFAIVCYPYSNINELFDDIHFAKRMGKLVNEYFPNRLAKLSDTLIIKHESTNLNNMTKALSLVATLPIDVDNKDKYNQLKEALNNFNIYLNIDQSGIILLDDVSKIYKTDLNVGKTIIKTLTDGNQVPIEFVKILDDIKDDDNSYYVSRRLHLSSRLGEPFDRLGIQSGFFYVVHGDKGNLNAVIYFVNHDHDLLTDSYLRESILMVATKIGDYLLTKMRQEMLTEESDVTSAVLKLSDYAMYKINPKTYQITSVSHGILDALAQKIHYGDYCYKAIYGLDAPCEKCPLKTGSKMLSHLDPWNIETTLTLNSEMSAEKDKIMLIRRLEDESLIDDPYDSNLLVNSFHTLVMTMNAMYRLNSRGYLLLLKFDNQMELVEKFGSETTTCALRKFAALVREFETISNVFFYRADTLAIVLSEYGQIDTVNECEKIFDLNRTSFFPDGETTFNITYLPISYPQGYPTANDFLRHSDDYYSSKRYELNRNFIYFDESGYARSANKNEFMLSVIDDKFTNKDFTVNLQPLVRTSTGKIFGAELLLRLSDDYRKIVFNTDQLIRVAAANGKIGLISSALLDYIATLYNQYGSSIFKAYGFERLTINTDYSYLGDDTLIQKITNLFSSTHMPKGFLGFEITEKEIYDHYDDMKKFMSNLVNLGIVLICDRYSGEFLSFNRLRDLGITEFKIDRDYTRFIDTDKTKYNMVRSLLSSAKDANVTPALIGVENMEQYKMIKEINPDSYLQGYVFFKPMEKSDLVDTIRRHNTAR